jgi:hypothetical protein
VPPAPDPVPPPPPATAAVIPAPIAPSPSSIGPNLYYEPDGVRRLGGWLRLHDDRARVGRITLGVLNLVMGAVLGAATIGALGEEDDVFLYGIGLPGVLLSAMCVGVGIGVLNITTPQEDRHARWLAARARGPIGPYEIGAFEGEIFGEAEQARFGRVVGAIMGFSIAGAGAAALGMGAAMDLDSISETVTYTIGGLYLGMGLVLGILSLLIETPVESDFDDYRRGLGPLDGDGRAVVDAPP